MRRESQSCRRDVRSPQNSSSMLSYRESGVKRKALCVSTYRVAQCKPQSSGSGSCGLSKYVAVTGDIITWVQQTHS